VKYGFQPGLPDGDGLCRVTIHGRTRFRYRSGTDWYDTDRAQGILWLLAETGVDDVIRWQAQRDEGAQPIGTVFMDQGAPLPPLQSRALVLCSGQPARFSHSARTAIYPNVPVKIAERVAHSIRQQISMID
jgi:hypothetical protein